MSRIFYTAAVLMCIAGTVFSQPSTTEPEYVRPEDAKFTVEEVEFVREVNNEIDEEAATRFKIAGAVRVPTIQKPDAGFPAVLFVSGSGSQTKHGFQGPLDIGIHKQVFIDIGSWELLDAVANAGFLTLSVDDRGAGKTPSGPETARGDKTGFHVLGADAQAALDYLKNREDVDAKQVFLIGHSEGGLTATILANENPGIGGLILFGTPGRNLYDAAYDQAKFLKKDERRSVRERDLKIQLEVMDAIKEEREPDFDIVGRPWRSRTKAIWESVLPLKQRWHDHFHLDIPAIQRDVECATFVAQGELDFHVSVEKDAEQLVKHLVDGRCVDLKFKVYKDLDHFMKNCDGEESTMELYTRQRQLSNDFVEDVVAWLSQRPQRTH